MPAYEFIVRYKEFVKSPGTWDEAFFSLGDWPYEDSLGEERVEIHPEKSPKWLSVHFRLRCDAATPYAELRVQAKDHARMVFRQHYPEAKLY